MFFSYLNIFIFQNLDCKFNPFALKSKIFEKQFFCPWFLRHFLTLLDTASPRSPFSTYLAEAEIDNLQSEGMMACVSCRRMVVQPARSVSGIGGLEVAENCFSNDK